MGLSRRRARGRGGVAEVGFGAVLEEQPDVVEEGGLIGLGGKHEVGTAVAEEGGELALGEQGVGGEGAALEVEFEVVEQREDHADLDPTACGRRALGLVVGADGQAVDLCRVWVTPLRWPTAPRMCTWHWFSPILPAAGSAAPFVAGSAAATSSSRVDGVAHGLAVDGDGVVGAGVVGVEALQGAVELVRVDAHQHVADDELAGHLVSAAAVPAAEPLAGARGQVLGPLGHGLVAARTAQRRAGGDGEHDGQRVAAALAAARVVDVGEEVGQGTHGVGGDHGFRTSVSVGGKQFGAGQARPRAANQGAHEHQLGRGRHRAVVAGQAPLAQRQHPRAQVRHPPPRQDQEPAVVGEQVLAVVLGAEVPADPAVARAALQRRRREAEQRQPLLAPVRDVPQRLADLRQRAHGSVAPPSAPGSASRPRPPTAPPPRAAPQPPPDPFELRPFLLAFGPDVQHSG